MPQATTILITIDGHADPDKYANAVLGCHGVLQLLGLADVATVWQDPAVATDERLSQLTDRWADANPWA